jgi:hypothetical protein
MNHLQLVALVAAFAVLGGFWIIHEAFAQMTAGNNTSSNATMTAGNNTSSNATMAGGNNTNATGANASGIISCVRGKC